MVRKLLPVRGRSESDDAHGDHGAHDDHGETADPAGDHATDPHANDH